MEYILTLMAGFGLGFLLRTMFHDSSIEDLTEENMELYKETWSGKEAEERALDFARKIKAVEDIIIDGKANKENYFVIIDKIEKELFQTTNQGK